MANPNPSPSTRFKPGNNANPTGRPKDMLTKADVDRLMSKFTRYTRGQLQAVIDGTDSPMLDVMVASIMLRCATDGDASRMNFLLDRAIGKVKESIEQTITTVTDAELDGVPRVAIVDLLKKQA